MSPRALLIPAIIVALAFPFAAYGHGGGLDSKGGHYDRKKGTYHYHRRITAPPPPKTVTVRDESKPSSPKTDDQIKRLVIQQSLASYSGNCPCPYNVDRAGRRCGKRSAYSRPRGVSPLCYDPDVTQRMVDAFRTRFDIPEPDSKVAAKETEVP